MVQPDSWFSHAHRPFSVSDSATRNRRQSGAQEENTRHQWNAADAWAAFRYLLVGTVVLVGALTFFPALALGPIVEHFLMQDGKLFSMLLFPIWS